MSTTKHIKAEEKMRGREFRLLCAGAIKYYLCLTSTDKGTTKSVYCVKPHILRSK